MCGAELRPVLAVKAVVEMPYHSFDGISGASMLRVDNRWIDPFIGVDSYTLRSNPFGPHPHAGMSAVSLTLPESEGGTINRDTMGDHSRIEPGDLHWFQAGRGAMHEETPASPGSTEHGLQIFVNLSRANKGADPVGLRVKHADIPIVNFEGGNLRVVAGEFDGQHSPITHDARWLTRVNMLDVTLQAGASVDIPVKQGDNAFFVVRSGSFEQMDGVDTAQSAIIFEASEQPGESIARIKAGSQTLRGVFFSGTPIKEPMFSGGPFMGNTAEDIFAYKRAFARGEMGHLSASH
ncbi:pirin family protein [Variovorax sp. PCZ-1]|uniref:pirin family protein n=1 Tax=Variovorax sp. PCZ-1 TaxID=2835533 RepID=UPI001BCB854A|nr:pirin family protein [Variovorax sp. PCZ-1]MBS7806463.1 pirin family protein [Variovorax sp. PCZ-1]